MRLYAHWLDGAFLKIKPNFPGITTIKTLALLGWNIILSQNQIIDSKVILRLFADRSFREFLEKDPKFLHLVGEPLSKDDKSTYAVATRSLHRCLEKGWISSTFPNPRPTRELARALLKPSEVYPERLLSDKDQSAFKVIKRWDEKEKYGKLLGGMVHAVGHFSRSNAPTKPENTASPRTSLYDKLIQAREILPSDSDELKLIKKSLDFIEGRGRFSKVEKHASRSIIFNKLDKAIENRQFDDINSYQTIKNTVMHAYNAAVQDSLSPEFGSNFNLPFSAPIGLILHQPMDMLVQGKPISEELLSPQGFIEWVIDRSPAQMSWNTIADVIRETEESRKNYQAALASEDIDEIQKQRRVHTNALTPHVTGAVRNPIPDYVWVGMTLATTSGISPEAGLSVMGVRWGIDLGARGIQKFRQYVIANALHRVARKFHLDS